MIHKKLLSLLVLLMAAVSSAWAQDNRFFLEVSGTSATLKWGEPISNDNPSLYPGSSWRYQGSDWTDKSGITTITVDASCTNCSKDNISALFYNFVGLQTINNIENIKTDAVKYLGSMFQNCSSLQTLDLSSWNTENVTSMNGMFRGCTSLQTLDLSSFNTGKVYGMSYMFKDCSTLTTIYVGDGWSTDKLTSSSSSTEMFNGCVSLPNWDNASPVIDKTNAHTGDGGYLTYKATFDYAFTVVPAEHGSGTIKFFIDQNEVKGAMQADEGKTVTMTITPDEGWIVDATSVKAESYSTWEAAGARRRSAPGNITILGDITLTKSTTAENTWTFTMPAASVLVSAAYIPVAAFAPAEPSGTLAPTAAEGVIAGEDKAIIVAGTVANIPETTNPQGTVKYFVTDNKDMTAEQAAKANGWVETLPTAAGYTGSYANDFQVYVWYYIQAATGYADSEPQRIEVTLQSNLFDLTFNAANANTIDATEASKGTVSVKVGTADAVDKTEDITDGKLEAIKMGSEVKMTTKAGYKFRKVEVKKASTPTLKDALADGAVTRIKFNYSGNVFYADFTYSNGSFTRTGGSQGYLFDGSWTMKEENGVLTMTANYNESGSQYIDFVCTFYADTNEYTAKSTGSWNFSFSGIEVNGTDITSQLTKVK